MIKDKIKELAALCKRWDELETQQNEVKAQIEKLIAPPEAKTVEPVTDQIQVGDLVEVVSGDEPQDIGRGGIVTAFDKDRVFLDKHEAYLWPIEGWAYVADCRKVAAHARPGAGT